MNFTTAPAVPSQPSSKACNKPTKRRSVLNRLTRRRRNSDTSTTASVIADDPFTSNSCVHSPHPQPSVRKGAKATSLIPLDTPTPPPHSRPPDKMNPNYPTSHNLYMNSTSYRHPPDRATPARAHITSAAELVNRSATTTIHRSPAQMHMLRMKGREGGSSGNLSQVRAGALAHTRSISPANPGYIPQEEASFGVAMNRRKALLIGITYRNHRALEELPGCTNDVKEMFALLTGDLFGFPSHSVKVLSDELEELGATEVEMPTRANILKHLKWLTEDIGSGDSVVFFFAGHGDFTEDLSGDEIETGLDQIILPVDFLPKPKHDVPFKGVAPILDDNIYDVLVRNVPSGAKVTAIVDACRSGTVCDLPVVYDAKGGSRYRNGGRAPRMIRAPHKSAGGTVLFSGSADHQLSVDMTIPHNGPEGGWTSFGVMTRSFVDAVTEMTLARDASNYNRIESWTYGRLFDRITELVRERTAAFLPQNYEVQEPQLSSSHPNVWEQPFTM